MTLNSFLVQAKQNTYAGGTKATRLSDGSQELIFEQDHYRYRDRYYGESWFVGEEVVFDKNNPFWSMNYAGRFTQEMNEQMIKELLAILRQALSHPPLDHPYRGPTHIQEGEWVYQNDSHGEINWFNGRESISFQGKIVYELEYHGGLVKE